MKLKKWATHPDVLQVAQSCGALSEVKAALERSYDLTADAPKRLNPSLVVERQLKSAGWSPCRVWAQDTVAERANDRFDGWKVFQEDGPRFGVGVEVEWVWNRVYFDFLKFWRGQRGGQIRFGIEILRGPSAFDYAVEHSYPLYKELIPDVRMLFCALDSEDLREPEYHTKTRKYLPFPSP